MLKKTVNSIKILMISIIFIFYVLAIPVFALEPSSPKIYQGIDVSQWQGNINFRQVKESGIQVVYIKSSEGASFVDPYFEQNYTNAKANGLSVGVYHYLTARTTYQATQQANFFVSLLSNKSIDCRLAMDFESFGDLNPTQINEISLAFLNEVIRISGKEVVVYSDTYNATRIFTGEITKFPLWVAEYGTEEPANNGNWSSWIGFQYTDVGNVSGINGYVDRNKFTEEIFLSDKTQVPDVSNPNPPDETGTTTIIIQRGDTLSEIALKYNTTVARLVELNKIANPDLIYAGEILVVPIKNEDGTSDDSVYIVQRGDTLYSIAQRYNTTVNALVFANQIKNPNLIFVGQRLTIPTNKYDTSYTLYKIRRGDTLYSIARRYNTSIANIVRLNRIANPNLIYAGETIKV